MFNRYQENIYTYLWLIVQWIENIFLLQTLIRRDSFETLKREFKPAICLDYIKAGVEAIIEDEVTSRFEAEELKVISISLDL